MNLQKFLDQERRGEIAPIARKASATNAITESFLRQQRYVGAFAADTERRASAAYRATGVLGMSEKLWRTNEQSRAFQGLGDDLACSAIGTAASGFQRLTDDLTRSAIANRVSETMRVSEAYHRIMDPIPALKSALGSFTAISPAFDSMRYVTPLAKLDRQMDLLRDHSFSGLTELRSTAFETMGSISAIVDWVKPFAVNPLFQTESVAGRYVDLAEVVDYADSHFASTAAATEIADLLRVFVEKFECEMATSRADAKSHRTINLFISVLTLLATVFSLYQNQASKHYDNATPIPGAAPAASISIPITGKARLYDTRARP